MKKPDGKANELLDECSFPTCKKEVMVEMEKHEETTQVCGIHFVDLFFKGWKVIRHAK